MIYFRCEASQTKGFGHLKRCLSLAAAIDATCVFLLGAAETQAAAIVRQAGFSVFSLPDGLALADEVPLYPLDCRMLVADIYNIDYIRAPEKVSAYFRALNAAGVKTAFIDGLLDEAFREDNAPEILAYAQPYLGAESDAPPRCAHWLAGGQYAMLGPQYADVPGREIKEEAENLLITFGGADPQGISRAVLDAAAGLDMNIRVIVGPYFSEGYKAALTGQGAEIVSGQSDLLPHYMWADMAAGGSGTSRYEFAACGLPAVFCAIYPQHERLSAVFASFGAARYLGLYTALDLGDWQKALSELKENKDLRRFQSEKGRALVDGKGTVRLAAALKEILSQ